MCAVGWCCGSLVRAPRPHRLQDRNPRSVRADCQSRGGKSGCCVEAIVVTSDKDHIEITTLGDAYEGRGDNLMVETAIGGDGISGRISVKAVTPGTNPNWIVFALTNPTDKPIESAGLRPTAIRWRARVLSGPISMPAASRPLLLRLALCRSVSNPTAPTSSP